MKFKIPFSARNQFYNENEINSVINSLNDSLTLTQGKNLVKFEEEFKNYIGAKNAFAVNSATSALEMVAQICQFKKGDEVIVPSHTYTSSVYPFIRNGAKIVWADIDKKTHVISLKSIIKNYSNKTKAIIVPHLYGFTADIKSILAYAKKNSLIVIEDAAQSIGTRVDKKMSGTFGDFGIFSFHSHKNISTLGEGGMLLVKDDAIANEIPKLRHNGHCSFDYDRDDYWKPAMGNLDMPSINGEYLMPNNFCIGEIQCALGVELLKRVDQINAKKRQRAIYFIDTLKKYEFIEFNRVNDLSHNYHLLAGSFNKKNYQNKFISSMAYDEGIQCVVQYMPLNRYSLYQKLGYGKSNCPNADEFFDNMVSFPFQQTLSDNDFQNIIESTIKIFKKNGF